MVIRHKQISQRKASTLAPEGETVVFRCWKCATEIVRMHSEYGYLVGWATCPHCQNGQGIQYSFPTAKAEVE